MPTKVAIIHDWLLFYRGGERVLEAICELYPEADIFTLFGRPDRLPPSLAEHKIHTSFLNHLPRVERYYRYLLPFFPRAIERFDLSEYNLVISSSHCIAKGVIPSANAKHLCYCHTPARYFWDKYDDYFGEHPLEPLIRPFVRSLRAWDKQSSSRVDQFVANSNRVRERIRDYYDRSAEVIHPFAALDNFTLSKEKRENFYLVVTALVPYKKVEIAVEACNALGRELWIVGTGPSEKKLKSLAGKNVRFLGQANPESLRNIYAKARALLFPGEEDFGIAPLEAMASGTPVIALGKGGILDTVIDGETGLFFREPTVENLKEALLRFEGCVFDPLKCRTQAEKFTRRQFQSDFKKAISGMLAGSSAPSLPS